jgi:O-antigen/teichoic acid export membrane protein
VPTAVDEQGGTRSQPPDVTPTRAASDVALQLVGRTANIALGVVVTLVLARHLGPSDFGRWSTLFALVQLTGYSGNLGLEQAAVGRATADPEHQGQWLGALVALRVALAAPVFLLTVALVLLVSDTTTMRTAGLIVATTVLLAALGTLRVVFQLRIRNDVNAAIELVNGIVWGASVLIVIGLGGKFVPLAAAYALTAAATTILLAVLALRRSQISFTGVGQRARQLARVGLPIGIGGILILAYGRIDQVFVFKIAGSEAAGVYGAAYRILDRVQIVPDAFLLTLFPLMIRARNVNPERLRRLVQSGFDSLLILSLPLLAFTIVDSQRIVHVLFGNEFDGAERALPVLMGAFVLIALGYLVGNLVIVFDRQAAFVRFAVIALVVNVVGNLALIPFYGFMAAAWMTVLTEAIVLTLTARLVFSLAPIRPAVGRAVRAGLAATGMALAVVLVHHVVTGGIVLDVLVAAVVYLGLVLAFRAIDVSELREILGR